MCSTLLAMLFLGITVASPIPFLLHGIVQLYRYHMSVLPHSTLAEPCTSLDALVLAPPPTHTPSKRPLPPPVPFHPPPPTPPRPPRCVSSCRASCPACASPRPTSPSSSRTCCSSTSTLCDSWRHTDQTSTRRYGTAGGCLTSFVAITLALRCLQPVLPPVGARLQIWWS